MMFSLCACGQSSQKGEDIDEPNVPEFGEYTGLTEFLSKNDIYRITYRPGTMGSSQELYVTDANEVDEIVAALEKVRISGITHSLVTDWYPSIILETQNGEVLHISFDGEWLVGANVNYVLSGMDLVWKLINNYAKEPDPLVSGDFVYEIIGDGEAEITEYTGGGGDVTIPEKIDGLTVTSIGRKAFYECDEITGLTFPSALCEIGRNAFAYCDGLTCLRINCKDLVINNCAFEYCDLLREIEISGENVIIGNEAFHYCKTLNSVVIRGNAVTIGSDSFEYCSALTKATVFGTESTDIADDAFSHCGSENFIIEQK